MSPLNNKGINEMNELDCLRALAARPASNSGGGGGATIASTLNLIAGDNAGNGVDSGVTPGPGSFSFAPNLSGFQVSFDASGVDQNIGITIPHFTGMMLVVFGGNPAAQIVPCPDGTVSPVTSITTVNGIITAIS